MKVFLVGYCDYSPDGDYPNTNTDPKYVEIDLAEAENRYKELSKKDQECGHCFTKAYLIEMETGVKGYKVLRGKINPTAKSVE